MQTSPILSSMGQKLPSGFCSMCGLATNRQDPAGNENAAAVPEPETGERPQNKQQLADLKALYASNQRIAYKYYQDSNLQSELKILFLGAYHMIKEYQETIETHKKGKAGSRRNLSLPFRWCRLPARDTADARNPECLMTPQYFIYTLSYIVL